MPRPARGQVIERKAKRGTSFAIRFRAPGYGRPCITLGSTADG